MYLKEALAREGCVNITKLNLGKNKGLGLKTGVFIGDALIANSSIPIDKLSFKKVYLGEDGLCRILEACNQNKNIKKVHLGYVSSKGLKLMADVLKTNKSLSKLKF